MRQIEIPIETVKIETVEKIVEVIKVVEKIVEIEKKSDADCHCISEVALVQLWNKLMNIKFADNKLSEDCVTEDRFTELLASNVAKNYTELMKGKKP